MKRRSVIFNRMDTVVVPFPFIESAGTKRRPALVISEKGFNRHGHTILAMITTKRHPSWPGDTEIHEYETAGLHLPCMIRLKLFTLDNRLILRKIGSLSRADARLFQSNTQPYLAF